MLISGVTDNDKIAGDLKVKKKLICNVKSTLNKNQNVLSQTGGPAGHEAQDIKDMKEKDITPQM